jgi:hypothetical protein
VTGERPGGRVLILDTENLAVRIEVDRDDEVFLVLTDAGNRVELPVTCPEEYRAAWRLAHAAADLLGRAACHAPTVRAAARPAHRSGRSSGPPPGSGPGLS